MKNPDKIDIIDAMDPSVDLAKEIIYRYNNHEALIHAGNDLKNELRTEVFYKNVYKVVSIVALVAFVISIYYG